MISPTCVKVYILYNPLWMQKDTVVMIAMENMIA